MSKIHRVVPTGPIRDPFTARLGAGTGAGNWLSLLDQGKFVKLVAESRFDLAAVGDLIEHQIIAVDVDPSGGYTVGSISGNVDRETMYVTADGLQATPGTGTIAVGDYVVVGTVVAKGTALPAGDGGPRVCKATIQLGSVPADLAAAGYQAKYAAFPWRVVSLGPVGTGAVGTMIVIKPV
jgi:hypothetical protein